MQISLETNTGAYTIRSYSPGEIKINERVIHHNLIITTSQLIEPWNPEDLESIVAQNPEIVLLGTGPRQTIPSPKTLAFFLQKKIGIEYMDTGAACRTFNVLASEGRKVVAALILA